MADKRRIILGLQRIGPRDLEAKPPMKCGFVGGPGWFRTSDLPRVRRTLSH